MRVPGQKFFVPATKIFAGMARSYTSEIIVAFKVNIN